MKRWSVIFWATLAILFAVTAQHQAQAHAALAGSTPAAGQVLSESPKELVLMFTEAVGPVVFRLLDKSGKDVGAPGAVASDGNNLRLPLSEVLPNGTYIVTYRVVSEDTHPIGGTLAFSVGEPMAEGTGASPADAATPSAWTWAAGANRWVLYAAMLLATGAALFHLGMAVPASAAATNLHIGRRAAVVAAVTYVMAIGLGGADLIGAGADGLFSATAWAQGAKTTLLPSAVIGIAAMAVLFVAFGLPTRLLLLAGVVLALASFVATGHAATADPVWVMAPAVAVHLACAAFWFAALPALLHTVRSTDTVTAGRVMTAFSGRAVLSVTLLVISGLIVSYVQVRTLAGLIDTVYGPRLLVKFGLFLLLLGLAAYNKVVLTPALNRADAVAASKLRRAIGFELVLYVLILGAAASLTLTPPPRALEQQVRATTSFKATATSGDYSAEVDVTPARAGQNMFMITVRRRDGQPVVLRGLDMTLALPAAGIADIEKHGEAAGPMWHVTVGETIVGGDWEIKVRGFVTDFDYVDFDLKIPIG